MRSGGGRRAASPALGPELDRAQRAIGSGRTADAARIYDRIWRVHEDARAIIALSYGRCLAALGALDAAFVVFERATALLPGPTPEAVLVGFLLDQGRAFAALDRLEAALRRFAVFPAGELAVAARRYCLLEGRPGWVGLSPEGALIGETIGRRILTVRVGDRQLMDGPENGGFRVGLKDPGTVHVLFDGEPAVGTGLAHPPALDVDGRCDESHDALEGWVHVGWDPTPERPIVGVDDLGTISWTTARAADPATRQPPGSLSFRFPRGAFKGSSVRVSVAVLDGEQAELPDQPFLFSSVLRPRASAGPRREMHPRPRGTDIIVPCYRGLRETRACIESVLSTVPPDVGIVVIDDGSPEPALAAWLDQAAAQGRLTLLRNERNLGFTRSANLGMALHRDRDVVLLNSDAVVFDDWLSRLQWHAYAGPGIATVTPWSNDGSIVSFPVEGGNLLDEDGAAALDRRFAELFPRRSERLPVGVGFCMLIRRDCLEEVGDFDEAAFPSGYGEEADFCLRAEMAGWSHRLAADVFVLHAGGRSFGSRRQALLDRGNRVLGLRHPDYHERVLAFLRDDPLHALRRRMLEHRWLDGLPGVALFVSLAGGGGVDRALDDRIELAKRDGLRPLVLRPADIGGPDCVLVGHGEDRSVLRYSMPQGIPELITFLRALPIHRLELHHFLGLDARLVESVLTLGIPYDAWLHDYVWICPQITLMDERRRYCGEPALDQCEQCRMRNGSRIRNLRSVSALRQRSGRWLTAARTVIVPTQDAAARLRRYFPSVPTAVLPWEPSVSFVPREEPDMAEIVRVVTIGAIGPHKGYDVLLACARDARRRRLPIEFVVLGYTEDDDRLLRAGPVFISGRYKEPEVPHLLTRERAAVAFFPSVWPETWCYALTHALKASLPVVAFAVGAFPERLRGYQGATLLPLDTRPGEINERFCWIARRDRASEDPALDLPGARKERLGRH